MIKFLSLFILLSANIVFGAFTPSIENCSREHLFKESYYSHIDGFSHMIECNKANFPEAMGLWGFLSLTKFDHTDMLKDAYNWSKKAADQGDKLGIATLSSLYFFNLGVIENEKQFLYYSDKINHKIKTYDEYQFALKKLNYNLPIILEKTYNHVEALISNEKKSKYWELLKKEADEQDLVAISILAKTFKKGNAFIPQNYTKSKEYFLKAAELGDADALMQVGLLYEDGLGVGKDMREAQKYYKMAAEQNSIDGKILMLDTPTLFGLQINKSNIQDVNQNLDFEKITFAPEKTNLSTVPDGIFYKTNSTSIDLGGVLYPVIWNMLRFDENGVLNEVKMDLPKTKYNEILTFLNQKYIFKEDYSTDSTVKYFQAGRANIILSKWDNMNHISLVYSKAKF